jgi:hypothetical protein
MSLIGTAEVQWGEAMFRLSNKMILPRLENNF